MIKAILCATRRADVSAEEFEGEFAGAVARQIAAVSGPTPSRVTVSTLLAGPAGRHDGLVSAWCTDAAQAAAFEAGLGRSAVDQLIGESLVVVAEPVTLRGEDWLSRRWQDPSPRLKHVALARRTPTLSAAEFDDQWRNHAGTNRARGAAQATPIPDAARGCAYTQNHPLLGQSLVGQSFVVQEWAYDAITEVWFDDEAGLRARVDYFAANPPGDELFAESHLLAMREHVL